MLSQSVYIQQCAEILIVSIEDAIAVCAARKLNLGRSVEISVSGKRALDATLCHRSGIGDRTIFTDHIEIVHWGIDLVW